MKYAQATLIQRLTGHVDALYAACLGPAGTVFTAGAEGVVVQWDTATGQALRPLAQAQGAIYSLAYFEAQGLLLLGLASGGVHILALGEAPRLLHSGQAHSQGVFAFAAVGGRLLSAGGDGQLIRWGVDPIRAELALPLSPAALRALALCPTGDHLAVGGSDGQIRILTPALAGVYAVAAHAPSVFGLAYSPEGRYLYSVGRDGLLKRWDRVERYGLTHELPAHTRAIQHVAVSPDGRYLATASMDKTVKLWRAADLTLLKVIDGPRSQGHTNAVNRVLWLPGPTRRLLSVGDDRQALVWDVTIWEDAPGATTP